MAIEYNKEDIRSLIPSLQRYMEEELDQTLSDFKTTLLLDYIIKEIGPYAYNKGVEDAEADFRTQVEDLSETCHEDGLTYWTRRKK